MLSRATSLEGFLVLRPATYKQLGFKPPKYLVDEIHRLLASEKERTNKLHTYLKRLKCTVPHEILQLFSSDAEMIEDRRVQAARSGKAAARKAEARREMPLGVGSGTGDSSANKDIRRVIKWI